MLAQAALLRFWMIQFPPHFIKNIQRAVLALTAIASANAAEDIVIADFEGADYGAWKKVHELKSAWGGK